MLYKEWVSHLKIDYEVTVFDIDLIEDKTWSTAPRSTPKNSLEVKKSFFKVECPLTVHTF